MSRTHSQLPRPVQTLYLINPIPYAGQQVIEAFFGADLSKNERRHLKKFLAYLSGGMEDEHRVRSHIMFDVDSDNVRSVEVFQKVGASHDFSTFPLQRCVSERFWEEKTPTYGILGNGRSRSSAPRVPAAMAASRSFSCCSRSLTNSRSSSLA